MENNLKMEKKKVTFSGNGVLAQCKVRLTIKPKSLHILAYFLFLPSSFANDDLTPCQDNTTLTHLQEQL